ncbi:MAG: hypothetical protein ING19_08755 [Azospirillum sp.]|nr:hypothetical protein [Azospirillum sp.]
MSAPRPENRLICKNSPADRVTLGRHEFTHLRTAGALDRAVRDLELPAVSDRIDVETGRFFYSVIENGRVVAVAELVDDGASFSFIDAIGRHGAAVESLMPLGKALGEKLTELGQPHAHRVLGASRI